MQFFFSATTPFPHPQASHKKHHHHTMEVLWIILGVVAGAGVGIWLTTTVLRNRLLSKSQQVLKDAEEKGEVIKKEKILQAKEQFMQLKSEHDKRVNEQNNTVRDAENKLKQREQNLNQRVEELQKKSGELKSASENLNKQIDALHQRQAEVEKVYRESIEKLEHIAGLSAEEAKQQLIDSLTEEARAEASTTIMDIVEEAKITAAEQAKKVVIQSIQRTATETAVENTVSVFNLENEEVKGRIIGREGRNIRTLESLTGVEIIKKDKILQAKEQYLQMKGEHEKRVNEQNNKIREAENKLKQREQNLSQKVDELQKKSNELKGVSENLNNQIEALKKRQVEVEKIYKESVTKLEHIAGMSAEEAKQQLVDAMTDEARAEASTTIMDIVEEAKITAAEQAKKVVIQSIQRTATETAVENTVSVFNLENEEVKGRIIGREGRNIRTLESLTGVEIIIDDSPDAIIISGFDPVRREIARLSLHKLVTDGRIHPARIEEVVAKTRRQIEQEINEVGKRTCIDLGILNMNHELMRMVGRMKYRSSYGQNLLQHSREVANLAATMAAELGLNPKLAKRAGLLHDIGKVPETDPELPHAIFGMRLAEKYKEHPDICNAIGAHHDEVEMTNLISPIIQVADAISGARPGARREVVEAYINRLNKLEQMAMAFPGVVKTYAIQAGRELRVIVGADKVSDVEANKLSYDLSRQIQNEMTYPGQIKVTVIRETRAINYAK